MTAAPWAAPDYAAHMAAQLAAMPIMAVTVFVRDSQGRRWSVLRLSPHTWQLSIGDMTYVRCLAGAVQVMESSL
jgi:ribosomal protein S11